MVCFPIYYRENCWVRYICCIYTAKIPTLISRYQSYHIVTKGCTANCCNYVSSRFITNIQALMGYAVAARCYCKGALYRIENVVNYSDKWYYFIFHLPIRWSPESLFPCFSLHNSRGLTESIKILLDRENTFSSGKL